MGLTYKRRPPTGALPASPSSEKADPTSKPAGGEKPAAPARYTARHRTKGPPAPPHRASYSSDLTDGQWALIEALFRPTPRSIPKVPAREVINAVLYINRTGCQWRNLPHDLPNWQVVWKRFCRWRDGGVWEEAMASLREQVRGQEKRQAQPTVGIIDSQTAKTTEKGGERGYDAGKKILGRKRHIAVDTLGMLLAVCVTGAGVQDRDGAMELLNPMVKAEFPDITKAFADSAYSGKLQLWVKDRLGWDLEIVRRSDRAIGEWSSPDQEVAPRPTGFKVLPWRWIVERTFGWTSRFRRMSKDYEETISSSTTWVRITMVSIMLRRLA